MADGGVSDRPSTRSRMMAAAASKPSRSTMSIQGEP
jgi:hypothetical protein